LSGRIEKKLKTSPKEKQKCSQKNLATKGRGQGKKGKLGVGKRKSWDVVRVSILTNL